MPLNLPPRPRIAPVAIPRIGGSRRGLTGNVLSSEERLGQQLSNAKKMQDLQTGELTQAGKMQGIENSAKQDRRNQLSMEAGAVQFYIKMIEKGVPKDQALDMAHELGYTGKTIDIDVDGPDQILSMTNADGSKFEIRGPRNKAGVLDNFLNVIQGNADAAFSGPGAKALESQGFNISVTKAKNEKWSAPKAGMDENGNQVFFQTDGEGNQRFLKGVTPTPKKGMKVYDRDGNIIADIGGSGDGGISKKTQGMLETKITNGVEQFNRIQKIAEEFKPEYQEIGSRLGAAWTGLKAKLGRGVSEEDASFLTDFKKYQRKAIENINLYIKEMTGAQMSEKEADRLRLAQPDPGENWWNGDDPITFKAKMDDVVKASRAAIARYEYYRNKGLSHDQIVGIIKDNAGLSLESLMERMDSGKK